MYFDRFPTIEYDFKLAGQSGIEILDILTRTRFLFDATFAGRAYNTHILNHGDTPDIIAHNYYGHSDWWWLVLLYNDIVNPFNELPRLGFDYKSIPGDYPNPNPVVYIERDEGDDFEDFKEGDIIIKIRGDGGFATTRAQPQPLQPSNADFATAKIITWRDSFREATLSDIQGGNFYAGDKVGVLKKENNSISLRCWGTVLKSIPNNTDAINHFIENDSGREVHPQTIVQTSTLEREIKVVGPNVIKGDTTKSLQGTLINAVLGGSGSSGTTYSQRYTAVTTKQTFDDYALSSIKLLDESFKDEARSLLNTLLTNRNMTYATFNSGRRISGSTNFINPPNSGGSNITTDTIY
jgi:hypothetical protein